ncbi:MAG: molybdopterin-dependent oxidoreductase [Polyangiaceae bacterium]|nr:molybdopterin-dependent oxidoreductase [Polyangiaceae bacterium]MCE7889783.1 molybdopterin oxidoreductase family protein [Sorangiineae bacterium PRO1]
MANVHLRVCPLCEATCGLSIETEGDRVTKIRGDELDAFSRGYICPKGVALGDLHHDPDRLRRPLRRRGERWVEVGWDEALDEAAERLAAVQREHGKDAVAVYLGNPTVHNLGALLFGPPFVRALGTKSRFSATSVDQLAHHVAAWAMFGHQLLLPVPDVDRTDFFLLIGSNPLASNGSLMTAPDVKRRLSDIRARGGKLVLVDPRRTETAEIADHHHFIRPGTDVYLLAALLQVIFAEKLERTGRLAAHTVRLSEARRAVEGFSPELAQKHTGIAAQEVRTLARSLAGARSAVVHSRMGASTQEHGGLCQWLTQLLNLVTGNLDRPGGAMFTTPALDAFRFASSGHLGVWRSRVRGLPEFGGELPVAVLAEEMETPGAGQIRALVTHAGNPVLSTPDGRRLERALAGLDYFVAIDFYKNETTRHAHLILPPTGPLEHDHYDAAFYLLAVRNFAKYSPAVFPKPAAARHEHEIFSGLTQRLLARAPLRRRLPERVLGWLGPAGMLDLGLRSGPHGLRRGPNGLSLARLRREPHGVDLGPLVPRLPGALRTKQRRIDAAPELFVAALAALVDAEPPSATELSLIGRRQLRGCNSWMHNVPRLMTGRERCTLLIHPDDARAREISQGDRVRVRSRVGEVELPVEVSDEVMRGVVSIPHGFGHDRPGTALGVAERHAGASINDLTDPERVDAVTGAAAFSGVPVEVTRITP